VTVLIDHGLLPKGNKAETEGPNIASYNFAKAEVDQLKGALQCVQWAKVLDKENSSLQEKTKYIFDAVCVIIFFWRRCLAVQNYYLVIYRTIRILDVD
jgi:hypothetical protein